MKNREYNNDWDNVNDIPADDYRRQYQEQLDRFSRMSGNDYNEEIVGVYGISRVDSSIYKLDNNVMVVVE